MSIRALLEQRIRERGPVSIAEYMELALAHPEFGYYMTRDPFGAKGDFTTAPEISQVFGELIGAWVASTWKNMGEPARATLLELGPGRGTLMRDALRATQGVEHFHDALRVILCETSPVLTDIQQEVLHKKHRSMGWIEELTPDDLPPLPLFVIANEFFDALPIRQLVGRKERHVMLQEGKLAFDLPASKKLHETCEPALEIIRLLTTHIAQHGGALLIIDYGYEGGSKGDTLQAVKQQQFIDALALPGESDLTAHVDFKALAKAAHSVKGIAVHGPVPQGLFLKRLGAELRATALCKNADSAQQQAILSGLERLVAPTQMGELFKAVAITRKDMPKPEGFYAPRR